MVPAVVVTGVSTGIGKATAEVLLARGFQVFGSVRSAVAADAAQKALGSRFVPLVFDVTDEAAIARAAGLVKKTLGSEPLAGLVNNAGIAVGGPLQMVRVEDFRRQLEVNLVGPLLVTQAFLPLLGAEKGFQGKPGRIVNISSVGGKVSVPFLGPYGISKHGLEAFSDSLRRELQLFGIDVIVVGPGAVATPIWDKAEAADSGPLAGTVYDGPVRKFQDYFIADGRKGLPPEAIGKVVWKALTLEKPKARYAVVPNWLGSVIPLLLPKRALDRILARNLGLRRG